MATKITILGSGAMGTACALLLTEQADRQVCDRQVWIWGRDAGHVADMSQHRENRRLLPGVRLPDSVQVTHDAEAAACGSDYLVVAIPTRFMRDTLTALAPQLTAAGGCPVVSVVKGIENDTFLRPSEIIAQTLGGPEVVALGGPSHAEEIARRLPASVVAACPNLDLARRVQELFTTERFRVYANVDILGVELGGALKNVIGIAAGISDGLGFGDNAKSALLTRGIAEMIRFGTELGANPATFSGLAGIGDLITTCISPHGRNRQVGERLGKGETLAQIQATMNSVAEGINTCFSVHTQAAALGIELPIVAQVHAVLRGEVTPKVATSSLMLRPLKHE